METKESELSPKQKILLQAFIAFGQGTGGLRVHRKTCEAIHRHYSAILDRKENASLLSDSTSDRWGSPENGPQALERVRTTARLAALLATQIGLSDIAPEHFETAARLVEASQVGTKCGICWSPSSAQPPAQTKKVRPRARIRGSARLK